MALPTFVDGFLISRTLKLSYNFDAGFYASLTMHFSPAIVYPWIIFESLCSPPGSYHNSPCTTSSRQTLTTGDRTISQLLPAKWGQDRGPGTNPLALSSKWIDEGAAAPPGRTWKTGKPLPSACDVPLPSEEAWDSQPPFATTCHQNDGENSGCLCFSAGAFACH